jgi:hypothetical protein
LESEYPGMKEKYLKTFNYQYTCNSPKTHLYKFFEQQCKKNKLHYKMKDIMNYSKLNPYRQISLFDLINEEER